MRSISIPLVTPKRGLRWLEAHWHEQRSRLGSADGQHPRSPQVLQELLEAILGVHILPECMPAASIQVSWLASCFGQLPNTISAALPAASDNGLHAVLFDAMKAISHNIQSGKNTTFMDLVKSLVTDGLIVPSLGNTGDDAADGEERVTDASLSLVSSLLGCMTMLYPVPLSEMPLMEAERPIADFLRRLDALMPSLPSDSSRLVELQVSNLNAQTLIDIGDITLGWTTQISDHLKFDHSTQVLSLFCLPSFCQLHMSAQPVSEGATLMDRYSFIYFYSLHGGSRLMQPRVLDGYYWNGPYSTASPAFNMASFSRQLCLTYRLLFANSKRARAIYEKSERQRAREALFPSSLALSDSGPDPVSDAHLDNLCRSPSPLDALYPARQTYDAFHDMPYFADRLQDLQQYILCQNPSRAKMLWKDRRDALRWYTFWAVITIGGVTIVLGVVQTILAGFQVGYARNSPS